MIPPAPTGPARFFYIVGILIGFAGIAVVMFAIGTTVAEGFRTVDAGPSAVGPDFTRIGEWLPIGLGLAIPGTILATIASAVGPHPRSGNDIRVDRGVLHTGTGNVHIKDAMNDHNIINAYISQVALGELNTIREIISALQLPATVDRDIRAYLDEAAWALDQDQPNADRLGDRLAKATHLMRQTGAFARAGGELVPRLIHLASLLGPAGNGIMRLLT